MKTKCVSGFVAFYLLLAPALPAGAAGPCQYETFSGNLTLRDFKDRSGVLGPGAYEESLVTATVTVKLIGTPTGAFTTHIVQAATGSGSYWFYFPSTCDRPPKAVKGRLTGERSP